MFWKLNFCKTILSRSARPAGESLVPVAGLFCPSFALFSDQSLGKHALAILGELKCVNFLKFLMHAMIVLTLH